MKKKIILFIVILLPLLAAFFVGRYAYADRYSLDSDAAVVQKVRGDLFVDYLLQGKTTEEKFELYLKFRKSKYLPEPVLSQQLKNSEGKDLYKIAIYAYQYNTTDENQKPIERIAYAVHIYDVQYKNIKDSLVSEDRESINQASDPILEVVFNGSEGRTFVSSMNKSFDSNGVPFVYDANTDSDDTKPVLIGDFESKISTWPTEKINIEIVAKIPEITIGSENFSQTVSTISFDDFTVLPEDFDLNEFEVGYNNDLNELGYKQYIIKKYVWWQVLLTFVGTGLLTFSFYVVWLSEEKKYESKLKNKKARG